MTIIRFERELHSMTFPQVSSGRYKTSPSVGNCYIIIASTPELDVVAILPTFEAALTTVAQIPSLDGIPWFIEKVFEIQSASVRSVFEAITEFRIRIDPLEFAQPPKGLSLYPDSLVDTFSHILGKLKFNGFI